MLRNHHNLSRAVAMALLGLGLLLSGRARAQFGEWSRIELEGGGVAEDIQLIRRTANNSQGDSVWSASMDAGGLFRAQYDNGWGSMQKPHNELLSN